MIISDDFKLDYKGMFLDEPTYLIKYYENPSNENEIIGVFRYGSSDKFAYQRNYTFPKEDEKEIENLYRLTIMKEASKAKDVNIIMFLCSLSYIGFLGMIASLFTPNELHHLVYLGNYLTVVLPQLTALLRYGESFPMFGPKRIKERKEYTEKLKLFLQYEEEIKEKLQRLNENNMNPYNFDGDIQNIREASHEEIISLTKRIK